MSEAPAYFVTHCPGFEDIVSGEVGERLPSVESVESDYGRVQFVFPGSASNVLSLRTINRACVFAASFEGLDQGPGGLHQLRDWAAATDFVTPLRVLGGTREVPDPPRFRVTGHRVGEHAYNSMAAAGAVGAGICHSLGWPVDLEDFDIDVRLAITDARAVVGLALTHESLHRRMAHAGAKAPLKASVAHCLVRLLGPIEAGPFLDPMCGTATIPIEAHALDAGLSCIGGDVAADVLAIARANAAAAGALVELLRWDARELPLAYQSIGGIASNLPFGRRIGSHRRNQHLYPRFIREVQRVLRPGARMVLLTLERRLLERLVHRQHRLRIVGQRNVSLSNLRPSVYEIQKLA